MSCQGSWQAHQFPRREALQVGVGLFGLSLPEYLRAAKAAGPARSPQDLSCIFLFLAGGPSHFETFDPKPDAPSEIRGPWNPIATNVPGTFISEKMPLMARRMDKAAIIRSWQGRSGTHDTASQHVASGMYPPRGGQYFPNFGCLVSAIYGSRRRGTPPHFGLPVAARATNPPAYLGPAHAAFDIKGDPLEPGRVGSGGSKIGGLALPPAQFGERWSLLTQLDNLDRLAQGNDASLAAHDKFAGEAMAVITSDAMRKAMDLEEEPFRLRERYGDNLYGRRVLLGRRLIEAGARFVTINHAVQGGLFGDGSTNGTWDNHGWLFDSMISFASPPASLTSDQRKVWYCYDGPGNLPQLDMSLSALLDDLDERGLLETTLVVAMGEFGRTPRINKTAGRDHYPNAGCLLMAGAGIARGVVVGATDRNGTSPKTLPCRPEDVAGSIYHALGIDHHHTYFPRLPRPTPIADGRVIEGLFA